MSKPKKTDNKLIEDKEYFRKVLQDRVIFHCNCINHYIAGCDSPFKYLQISDVQEKLREICEILGIEEQQGENA